MAKEMNLNLISPYDFMQSVSQGSEPPAKSVATFINQLNLRQPAILIYNQQTESPITQSMKNLANNNGIGVLGITETMPSNTTYEQWMNYQINQIDRVLSNAKQ
jgi:zinc/manganese transport system substrate-binding protein